MRTIAFCILVSIVFFTSSTAHAQIIPGLGAARMGIRVVRAVTREDKPQQKSAQTQQTQPATETGDLSELGISEITEEGDLSELGISETSEEGDLSELGISETPDDSQTEALMECDNRPGGFNLTCPQGYTCVQDQPSCPAEVDCLIPPGVCVPVAPTPPPDLPPFCGTNDNILCPDSFRCVDDPSDECNPETGGLNCKGVCIAETPSPTPPGPPKQEQAETPQTSSDTPPVPPKKPRKQIEPPHRKSPRGQEVFDLCSQAVNDRPYNGTLSMVLRDEVEDGYEIWVFHVNRHKNTAEGADKRSILLDTNCLGVREKDSLSPSDYLGRQHEQKFKTFFTLPSEYKILGVQMMKKGLWQIPVQNPSAADKDSYMITFDPELLKFTVSSFPKVPQDARSMQVITVR